MKFRKEERKLLREKVQNFILLKDTEKAQAQRKASNETEWKQNAKVEKKRNSSVLVVVVRFLYMQSLYGWHKYCI